MTGSADDGYGFQRHQETGSPTPNTAILHDFGPDAASKLAAWEIAPPDGFWTSPIPAYVRLREEVCAIWRAERQAEENRSDIESMQQAVIARARSGSLGKVELRILTDTRGRQFATHIRFNFAPEMMTIAEAMKARLL